MIAQRAFLVPFITIVDGVKAGEELILESQGKEKKECRKRTWRDVEKEDKQRKNTKRTLKENTFPQ